MVDHLGDEFHFRVVTRDRECGDIVPYDGVRTGAWHQVGKAEVRYLSPSELSPGGWSRLLCATRYELLYLNSFFSPRFTILPLMLRRLGLAPRVPVLVAPRGELCPGALADKARRKYPFIRLAKALRLYDDVLWHSCYEEQDIRRWFGSAARVLNARFLFQSVNSGLAASENEDKLAGQLRIAFVSRICPKKNLAGAIRMLRGIEGDVAFNIYGPADDHAYWTECQRLIRTLPPNIHVLSHGTVEHARVGDVIRQNHLFFLPTWGDNFGRVIIEALLAGRPVLISNQTPWSGLAEEGAGWALPLDRVDLFRAALQECVAMDGTTFRAWSRRARDYGLRQTENRAGIDQHRMLFLTALGQSCQKASGRLS